MEEEQPDRGGDDDAARPRELAQLRRENERLRRRLDEKRRERERIVDRYETLLDAARRDEEADCGDADGSTVARLFDRLRNA